jgi:hypothetical protein
VVFSDNYSWPEDLENTNQKVIRSFDVEKLNAIANV